MPVLVVAQSLRGVGSTGALLKPGYGSSAAWGGHYLGHLPCWLPLVFWWGWWGSGHLLGPVEDWLLHMEDGVQGTQHSWFGVDLSVGWAMLRALAGPSCWLAAMLGWQGSGPSCGSVSELDTWDSGHSLVYLCPHSVLGDGETVGLRALTCLAWFGLLAAEWGGVGLQVFALPRQGQGVCLTHRGSVFARVGQSWGGWSSDAARGGQTGVRRECPMVLAV